MKGLALAALAVGGATGHYVWLANDASAATATITFSEAAGQPGVGAILASVEPATTARARARAASPWANLTLVAADEGGGMGALVGAVPAALSASGAVYALEASVPYGLFEEGDATVNLAYYASAPAVAAPNDWFAVQDALANRFEVTLRDPYMDEAVDGRHADVGAPAGRRAAAAAPSGADQCPSGVSSWQGDACVVAVVRFDGELFGLDVNLTTFDGETGAPLRTSELPGSALGVAIVRAPVNADGSPRRVFARVNYREDAPGVIDGTAYAFVDHFATTSGSFARPPQHGSEVGTS